jgi:hypothetical protein
MPFGDKVFLTFLGNFLFFRIKLNQKNLLFYKYIKWKKNSNHKTERKKEKKNSDFFSIF